MDKRQPLNRQIVKQNPQHTLVFREKYNAAYT